MVLFLNIHFYNDTNSLSLITNHIKYFPKKQQHENIIDVRQLDIIFMCGPECYL